MRNAHIGPESVVTTTAEDIELRIAAAQSTLARKLIEAVEAVPTGREKRAWELKEDALTALRDTCKKLGVNVDG